MGCFVVEHPDVLGERVCSTTLTQAKWQLNKVAVKKMRGGWQTSHWGGVECENKKLRYGEINIFRRYE